MDRVALGVPAVNIHTEVIVSSLALKTGNWHYRQTGQYIVFRAALLQMHSFTIKHKLSSSSPCLRLPIKNVSAILKNYESLKNA